MALKSALMLLNKSAGSTSFRLVARLRRLFGLRRVGFAGTLDPFADGLMLLALGQSCSVLQFMEAYEKSYHATALLGQRTSTLDPEGEVLVEMEQEELAKDFREGKLSCLLTEALADMQGEIEQLPPMFSALKYQGRPLYSYARAGLEVPRRSRKVQVKLEAYRPPYEMGGQIWAEVDLHCSKGTYIRSWVADWAERAGYPASTYHLTRTALGPFRLEEARKLDELESEFERLGQDREAMWAYARENGYFLDLAACFPDWPLLEVDEATARRIVSGDQRLTWPAHLPKGYFAVRLDGQDLAVYHKAEDVRLARVLLSHEDLS